MVEVLLGAVALLSACGAGVCTAVTTALGRITRAEISDSQSLGRAGARIMYAVTHRPAATAGLAAVRFILTCAYALCVTLLVLEFVTPTWEAIAIVLAASVLVSLLLALISPIARGAREPLRVLRMFSLGTALITAMFSVLVREREPTPEESEQLHEDQLARMVDRVSESEALDDEDRELLQSVFDLGTTLVREVMVPRTDMVTIHADQPLDKVISLFTRSGYSRVPVVGENVDDVRGVVYLKDVMRRIHHRNDIDDLVVADVMRQPVFVPETKVVDDLMREMQADQVHIALVVDEYGGIAGLVTIEDLVEELVGEIADEHDQAEPEVEDLGDGVYRVPARLPIDELGDLFGVSLEDDDVDTAGGLLAKSIGRVPIAGAETNIGGIHLAAERFVGRRRRLATIIATRLIAEQPDAEGKA
ncbi:MAG: HlyC/CorC family transporter [Actinomycetaceae bacterium]|nr:HlyC/CorC family transporter [Actinomycetaceae bacterium]